MSLYCRECGEWVHRCRCDRTPPHFPPESFVTAFRLTPTGDLVLVDAPGPNPDPAE